MVEIKGICECFLLYLTILGSIDGSAGKVAESFVIYHLHGKRERCIHAIPPRTVRLEDCKSYDNHFRWRWTENGQVQNVKTGLCLELNDYDVIHHQYTTLYLGTCNYRKGLQKWRCEHRFMKDQKFYRINPAHERLRSHWVATTPDYKIQVSADLNLWETAHFGDGFGANICDFNRRDPCLQTIGEIPTPVGTCLITVATGNINGYAEIDISNKKPLDDFSVFMWVKPRLPDNAKMALFSYVVKNDPILALAHYGKGSSRIGLFNSRINIDTTDKHVLFRRSHWILITLTRSVKKGTLSYYVNDILIHNEQSVSRLAIPGTGTLHLGHSEMEGAQWYNGFISQVNIYNWAPSSHKQIEEQIRGQHCCLDKLRQGNWLSWNHMIGSWKLHGSARVDRGVECTSFEKMPEKWISTEYSRETCISPLLVSDPKYVLDYQFTATSWTSSGKPWYGRASKKIPSSWCPENNDKRSYLQVDLGYVQKVSAVGTMYKLQRRHARRLIVHSSTNGVHWNIDGQVYLASQSFVPEMRIVRLISPVMARYIRLYPTGCLPSQCCLAVEIYGCDPETDERILQPENGCTGVNKPNILMYFPVQKHVTRIQLKARTGKKPIGSFYLYYMAWRQWIPYQVNGKIKVFGGNSDTSVPFTHILPVPIFTHLVKIVPISFRGTTVCGDFTFIGCLALHEDFCSTYEVVNYRHCNRLPDFQCDLGFVGNGRTCQDLNECDIKTGAYCDPNSVCKNNYGSFACDPCKNSFIGDGRICQTSCEALGFTCGVNSYCDLDKCKCYEGFIYNGTHCAEDPDFGKVEEQPTISPDEIDGICPDGFFNCYGDVIGSLDKLRKAALSFENYDIDDCSDLN